MSKTTEQLEETLAETEEQLAAACGEVRQLESETKRLNERLDALRSDQTEAKILIAWASGLLTEGQVAQAFEPLSRVSCRAMLDGMAEAGAGIARKRIADAKAKSV